MVTNYGGTGDLMCSSTDVKPTDVAVNTRCLELDTGKFWYFNGTSWTETPGGGGGSATLIEKSITANGTYTASSDDADGYSSVEVDVPNTYTVDDNGKVVSNQTLVVQTAKPDTITVNDTYNTTEYNSVTVNVPNTYTAADEGKVVSDGDLVAQTAYPSTIVTNGTYDTTLNNSVTVDVPTGDNTDLINLIERDITSITIPSGTTRIGIRAFSGCTALASVTIPNTVTTIDSSSFYGCGFTSIEIPVGVTVIGDSAFSSCNLLTSITLPNGVTSIGQSAFYNCPALTSIEIPIGVTRISTQLCFACISLTSVTLPNGLTHIGDTAFANCRLTSIEIPSTVTNIGTGVFQNCKFTFIKFLGSTPPTVASSNAWYNIPTTCVIYVPTGSLSAYTSAQNYPNPNTFTYVEY